MGGQQCTARCTQHCVAMQAIRNLGAAEDALDGVAQIFEEDLTIRDLRPKSTTVHVGNTEGHESSGDDG